ncbi:MAG TPA: peroxiredoxin-like family protein [Anaerolineales bacterium]|nr:peroxiredoxin-like family protein [Anaerolineales bacterium]
MRLKAGDRAIPFSAETIDGKVVSLDQFAGKPLLLMFYRYASCPMCNLRLRDFAVHYPELHKHGLEAVAFFHSPGRNIRANAGKRYYPFHLVADPSYRVYRTYGIETSWLRFFLSMLLPSFYVDWIRAMRYGIWGGVDWQMGKMPADFLIGPDGRLIKAHYGRDIGDHLSVKEIEDVLADLNRPAS